VFLVCYPAGADTLASTRVTTSTWGIRQWKRVDVDLKLEGAAIG